MSTFSRVSQCAIMKIFTPLHRYVYTIFFFEPPLLKNIVQIPVSIPRFFLSHLHCVVLFLRCLHCHVVLSSPSSLSCRHGELLFVPLRRVAPAALTRHLVIPPLFRRPTVVLASHRRSFSARLSCSGLPSCRLATIKPQRTQVVPSCT